MELCGDGAPLNRSRLVDVGNSGAGESAHFDVGPIGEGLSDATFNEVSTTHRVRAASDRGECAGMGATRPARMNAKVFMGCLFCLSLLGPLYLALDMGSLTTPAMLAIAVIVVSGARFSYLVARGEPRLMELSTWSFTYVFFGLAPLVQIQQDKWPVPGPQPSRDYLGTALWAVLVSVSIAVVFAMLGRSRQAPLPNHAASPTSVVVHEGRAVMLSVVALLLNAYFLARVGPSSLLLSRHDLRAVEFAIWPDLGFALLIIGASTMPLLVAFVALLQTNRQRRSRGVRGHMMLPLLTGLAVLYSVNPISSPRYYFGTVILTVMASLGAYATPKRVRISAVGFLLGLFLLFPLADMFRRSIDAVTIEFQPIQSLTSGDFDGLVQMMNALRFVDLEGITWGQQALGVILFWVPRSYWENKPIDSATLVAEHAGYDFTNMSAPLWAELLLNGGWFLVIVGMAAFGWWLRRRDDAAVALWRRGGASTPLGMILPFYLIILLRGSLLQAMVYLVIIAIAAQFVTVGRGPAKPRGRPVAHESSRGRTPDALL